MNDKTGGVFISYTRQEGASCAGNLCTLLRGQGIEVWLDRSHMVAGIDFWRQIEEAIERCSYLLMVLTPDMLEGDRRVLRQEWYTARKFGTCVVPVQGVPGMNLADDRLPRWLPSRHVYDLPTETDKLIAQLRAPCRIERVPFMVDDLPDPYVVRADLHEAVVAQLLDERLEGPMAITTALRGAGGFGKTTLAQAVCHDDRVIAAFKDGILWATLGEQKPPPVSAKLAGMYAALTGERPAFIDADDAANTLAARLQYKRCLIVVDDVWDPADLQPFFRGAPGAVRLITTRQAAVAVKAGPTPVMVDEMTTEEAAALLATSLPGGGLAPAALTQLARRLGEWPMLLSLFAGHVRECMLEGQPAADAVAHLLQVLAEAGITALDRASEVDRHQAVAATLDVSLTRLAAAERVALHELSIFPEDADIAIPLVAQLWSSTGTLATERLRRLANLGLVRLDLRAQTVRLHDVIRTFLARQLGPAAPVHARLVAGWPDTSNLPHPQAWRWLAYHLAGAGQLDVLRGLLGRFAWLRAKLAATDAGALVADFDALPADDPLRAVEGALRLAFDYIAQDPAQLPGQLLGRLRQGLHPAVDALRAEITAWRGQPWLRPLRPMLHAPGGSLLRVIRGYAGGHTGSVRSIAIDGEGRWAVSAGNSDPDQTVIVWNLAKGTHHRLPGEAQAGGRTPLAMTANGDRFVSAFGPEIRAWRVVDAAPLGVLPGDGQDIRALAIADDGDVVVAGAADGSVRRCSLRGGGCVTIGRHGDAVEAVAVTPDGAWAASINGVEARLWNLREGSEYQRWPTPGFAPLQFTACLGISDTGRHVGWGGYPQAARSADGRSAVFRGGQCIVAYDSETRTQRLLFQHAASEGVLCFSAAKRRALVLHRPNAFGSTWVALGCMTDPSQFVELPLVGRDVTCAAISRDGRRAITADYEHDLMVWDLDRAEAQPGWPSEPEGGWRALPFAGWSDDGLRAVFGLDDAQPVVWDTVRETPVGDAAEVTQILAALRARREAAKPPEAPVPHDRIRWRVELTRKGPVLASRGHVAGFSGGAVAVHGRWDASVSEDGTVRVWLREPRRELAVFSDATIFRDCSWSSDGATLAVTDYRGKTHLLRLEGVAVDP
jgi:WD40 repeat protein